ncbi:MAG TPA: helix-turn-helix transcriptional regulator [Pyrinomonadaceae bacterium]|nr:helix-turn-helix transcriptional regulator [Pyrinomonadaceae bacterium]
MGYPRPKPERLAEKLRQIRDALGLSQGEMLRRLGLEDTIELKRISDYELGKNEPPLVVLLQYARVAAINMEALVDDELNLPRQLPSDVNHQHLRRKYTTPTRHR